MKIDNNFGNNLDCNYLKNHSAIYTYWIKQYELNKCTFDEVNVNIIKDINSSCREFYKQINKIPEYDLQFNLEEILTYYSKLDASIDYIICNLLKIEYSLFYLLTLNFNDLFEIKDYSHYIQELNVKTHLR